MAYLVNEIITFQFPIITCQFLTEYKLLWIFGGKYRHNIKGFLLRINLNTKNNNKYRL